MTSQNNLEIRGTLRANPFAELLAETFAANLTGSLRLSSETHKIVVYFNSGKPVFAASNARRHRLFEMLLQEKRITQNQLTQIPNFTNDIELSEALKAQGVFSKEHLNLIFSRQIENILRTALDWADGEWIFSPLARAKETVQFNVDLQKLLLEYARKLLQNQIVKRFKSFNESFGVNPSADIASADLMPQEAFVLTRFEKAFLKITEVKLLSGLPDATTLQILYTLWLGGFLFRQNWNPAFPERKISEIHSAKLSLKKDEAFTVDSPSDSETKAFEEVKKIPRIAAVEVQKAPAPNIQQTAAENNEPKLSLDDYLNRIENSSSFYEILDIAADADLSEIKRSYFALAKQFHPDKYHQERGSDLLRRVQNAFTQIAQAYETLKGEETRRNYDLRLGKQLAALKTKSSGNGNFNKVEQLDLAKEYFDRGFTLLMDEEYNEALPLLARAAQMAPDNARYHAFYGKVLSSDETQRHKAEAEMQAAIRLEPQNATFRIIMAEFYIQFKLFRRAEGELQRLLSIYPGNKEARALLDSLPKK